MFPTSGYFKSIPCPSFNSGICERPYCHFKHQKAHKNHHIPSYSTSKSSEPTHRSNSPSSSSSNAETPAAKTTGKVRVKSAHRSAAIPRPHYQHEPFPTGPSTLIYKPTPISELNKLHATEKASASSDKVLSAQFQVIGQTKSSSSGDGDGNTSIDNGDSYLQIDFSSSLEIEPAKENIVDAASSSSTPDTEQPAGENTQSIEDNNQSAEKDTVPTTEDTVPTTKDTVPTTEDIVPTTEADDQPATDSTPSIEKASTNSSIAITIDTKQQYSKQEIKEFADLFGEASDEEIDNQESVGAASDEDVIEMPKVTKFPEHVIDLTGGGSDEDSNGDWEEVREDIADNFDDRTKNSYIKREHAKTSSKSHATQKKTADQVTPITVSSSSNTGQCKELFAMFQQESVDKEFVRNLPEAESVETITEASRKRKARDNAKESSLNVPPKKSKVPTPQEVMTNRFEAIKKATLDQQRKRKELVQNGLKQTSKKVDFNSTAEATSSKTYKGVERKAHEPKSQKAKKSLERPRIDARSKSKVAASVRQLKLDMIINECLQLYPDEADAYERAKKEEEVAVSRAGNRIIYTNLVANVIKKIRGETGAHHTGKAQTKVSHESVLAGKSASKFTVGLKRKNSVHLTKEDMHGDLLFKKLRSYVLTEKQLVEQGYPRPDPGKPGRALVQWTHFDKVPQIKGNMRICKRCGKSFLLTDDNDYVSKEDCVYHWGKTFHTRVHGTVDMHFSCCQGKPGAEGCTICYGHVHESNKFLDLTGFMKTFAKKTKDYCGVYALDCEMVYSTKGMEIARVTVINDKLGIMLDSFIKPECEVIDYNTRFSGLTEDNFTKVNTSLKDVQAILLDMFQEDTVLIGHSLNSDLVALKLIHESVVDTSMVWPHKHGLPYKRALKTLMLEILNKLIQESGSAGHDSSEDASACMELMKWKVHQDYMKDNR